MATIRKRGSRFQAIVRRKQQSISKSFTTRQDAESWARHTEVAIERRSAVLPNSADGLYFTDLIRSYREHCIKSARGIGRTRAFTLDRFEVYFRTSPAQLTKGQLQEFAHIRIEQGIKPATLMMDMNYLKAIAKHAREYMDLNIDLQPFDAVNANLVRDGLAGRSEERDIRPTDDELSALFCAFQANQRLQIPMEAICKLSLATSMRLGEICKLKWEDYNARERTIIIRSRKSPIRPKDQIIPLITNLPFNSQEIIEAQRRLTGNQALIFPYNARSASRAFARTCRQLSIENLRFHDLRHDAISRMFDNNFQIQHIRVLSGHSDLKQLSRYTNIRPSDIFKHQESIMAQNFHPSAIAS